MNNIRAAASAAATEGGEKRRCSTCVQTKGTLGCAALRKCTWSIRGLFVPLKNATVTSEGSVGSYEKGFEHFQYRRISITGFCCDEMILLTL